MNLYVHVPFCASKCRYCAFYSAPAPSRADVSDWLRLLPRELALRGLAGARPDTVYAGGGTPSLLGADGLRALFAALPRPAAGAELSVELNPADVTPDLARALRDCGVSRASLGAQSFDPATLAWLGRRHGPDAVRAAARALRDAGVPSLSLDLIAAIPGEDPAAFARSLREAVALGPDHVSVYPLSVEPGTPLARAGVAPAPDDAALAAVAEAESFLAAEGYARYELSNYARPGAECRHNLAVWRGEDYSGIGPAAHSREGLSRRANAPDFAAWRDALEAGRLPPAAVETLAPGDDEAERFALRVRLARWRGPDPATPAGARRAAALAGLARNGLVRARGGGDWTLTPRGREIADSVMAALAWGTDPAPAPPPGPPLVLASASPRRRAVLERLGVPFDVLPTDADEPRLADPVASVRAAALAKHAAAARAAPAGAALLAADTLVECGGRVLGKPHGHEDAVRTLLFLSGREHLVHTAVAASAPDRRDDPDVFVETTRVRFRTLSRADAEAYLDAARTEDRAGAYDIATLGDRVVASFDGSFTNVMGLPAERVAAWLGRLRLLPSAPR